MQNAYELSWNLVQIQGIKSSYAFLKLSFQVSMEFSAAIVNWIRLSLSTTYVLDQHYFSPRNRWSSSQEVLELKVISSTQIGITNIAIEDTF